MNDYEQKKADRIDRLRSGAQKLTSKGHAALGAARAIGDQIPFGQPILVGHHSEKRHRRAIERIDAQYRKGFDALKEGKELEARADAAESNTAISSDDPSAIEKLEAKLLQVKAEHARDVAGNKAIRAAKGDREAARVALLALGFTEKQVSSALMTSYGDKVCGFFVNNASATVRATEKRIAELRAKEAAPERAPLTVGDATMTWNKAANRVQIRWPARPGDATCEALSQNGFRWAPSTGAWQRHASEQAWYRGEQVIRARTG